MGRLYFGLHAFTQSYTVGYTMFALCK